MKLLLPFFFLILSFLFAVSLDWLNGDDPPASRIRCDPADPGAADPDLYCFDLTPVPELQEISARIQLRSVAGPFGIDVNRAGYLKLTASVDIAGLPEVESLGDYTVYVAWLTTLLLHPMINLGPVENGVQHLGEIELPKFMIMITAEEAADVAERGGKIVARGLSPSNRAQAHAFNTLMERRSDLSAVETQWPPPPMNARLPMMPALAGLLPESRPWVLGAERERAAAQPSTVISLPDGGTLDLTATIVSREIRGKSFLMYAFNGQHPGPLLRVGENSTITVNFTNEIDQPTTVHWHGVRVDNRFDGVPGVTQDPVLPGQSFQYRVHFPDPGLYWYHPHVRGDVQIDLGLYGNMDVMPAEEGYYGPVNRVETLMLDDFLMADEGPYPYGDSAATQALMGRFGNVFLLNGEPDYRLDVNAGEVVRFQLTNVSNTRTFNLSFGELPVKVVGSDVSRFEREELVESVVIAPAERYVVEVRFPDSGAVLLANRVLGLIHTTGDFFEEVDTLGVINVSSEPTTDDYSDQFSILRSHESVIADIDRYRDLFEGEPDFDLLLTLEVEDLPFNLRELMRLDSTYFAPVEWSGTMPTMNWLTTSDRVRWIIRDVRTGSENREIDWSFSVGDVVKIRIRNDRHALHAMQHPIHVHGQRFLVVSRDGVPSENLVWKDTVLLPVGSTAEILLELTNPGTWLMHCHIAEHIQSGMVTAFEVLARD